MIKYLHYIKIKKNKFCECENVKNVVYVLLKCSKRVDLKQKHFDNDVNNRNLRKLLNISNFVMKFTIFIKKTNLLQQYRYFNNETFFKNKNKNENF